MPTLAELAGATAPAKSLGELAGEAEDPLAGKVSYKEAVIDNGLPGSFAKVAKALPGAIGHGIEGAGQTVQNAALGLGSLLEFSGKLPEQIQRSQADVDRLSQPITPRVGSLGIPTNTPPHLSYGQVPVGTDPYAVQNRLREDALGLAKNELKVQRDVRDTGGVSVARDLALSGLLVSGAGTGVGVAATVGFPAVMEATGAQPAIERLGQNVSGAIRSVQPDNYYLGKVGDIAGEVVGQGPTLAALGIGGAASSLRRNTAPVRAGAPEAAPVAETGPTLFDQTLGPLAPGPKDLNLLTLIDKVLPNKVTDPFRGELANLKRYAPEAGEAAQLRKEALNLTNKDATALSEQIRTTLSEAEQKRLNQIAEGLPARRIEQDAGPTNTAAYNERYAKYHDLAKADVETNSPGLSTEFKEVAARAIATSRLYEDMGVGAGEAYKSWSNYKPTSKELAPLNKLEQDLRAAEYPSKLEQLPSFEEGTAQVRAAAERAKGRVTDPALLPEGGLSVPEPVSVKPAGPPPPTFDPAVAKAIVQKFDPNTELTTASSKSEAHAAVKEILQRVYKERPGYVKHMYVEKMADSLNEVMLAERGMSWARKSGIKEDRAGATQRQDPSLTAGLTRVRTAAEPVSTAIHQNGAYAAARDFNDALAATPFLKAEVTAAEQAAGWHQVGPDKSNGAMAGKWVDPKLWEQIGEAKEPGRMSANFQSMTNWWARNTAVGKVSGNMMNFAGAHLANDMFAGIPLWEAPAVVLKGMGAYAGKYATDVKKLGTGTLSGVEPKLLSLMEAELAPVKAAAEKLNAQRKPGVEHITDVVDYSTAMLKGGLKYLMTEEGASVVDPKSMAKLFQAIETVNRNGTYVHLRDKGMTHAQARDLMNKAQVDYTDPSPVVAGLRNYGFGGVGNRFAQFGMSQSANLIETAFNANPLVAARVWKYPMLSEAWNKNMSAVNGEKPEERKKRLDLAKVWEGFPASTFILDMPRNPEGHVQSFNLGRMNPAGWTAQMMTGMREMLEKEGDVSGGLKQVVGGAAGLNPSIAPILNILNRHDPFYGKDPLPDTALLSPVGVGRGLDYMASKMMPESLGSIPAGAAQLGRMQQNRLNQSLRGTRVQPDELLIRNLLGVKVGHFDPAMEDLRRSGAIQSEAMKARNLKATLSQDVTEREGEDLTKEHLRNVRRLGRPYSGGK